MTRDKLIAAFAILVTGVNLYALYNWPLWQDGTAQDKTASQAPANRLKDSASPYLRQHADNPVHWQPWSEEAFAKARREDKPVFLSVGYATCHWCHVMERESFSDPEIARLLNGHFIAIKVDRERRPDLDEIYMLATEIITKSGGWPNSVFLTPDKRPFHGGGYFPKDKFAALLKDVIKGWRGEKRKAIEESASHLAAAITRIMNVRTKAVPITRQNVHKAVEKALSEFDSFNGGFATAPKFPQESLLHLLLHLGEKDGYDKAQKAALLTLDKMLAGGIYDQLGGGFHRYAIDNEWLIPHFEKMLYTQAQMARLLITAHRLTDSPRYARAARKTLDFVLREMTAPGGAFYSGFDADSKGPQGKKQEGAFYVWTLAEFEQVLGPKEGDFAATSFGLTASGNFRGRNILHRPEDAPRDPARLEKIRKKLLAARNRRPRPFRDEKIIAAWNGLMIEALALAAGPLKQPGYLEAAQKAARFTLEQMGAKSGQVWRIFFEGKATIPGQLNDYAALAQAYLTLYDITGDADWGKHALTLAQQIRKIFRDDKQGGYFMTASRHGFARPKQKADGALPAATAMVLGLFDRLTRRTGLSAHREAATELSGVLSGLALAAPISHAAALEALDRHARGETGPIQYLGRGKVRVRHQKAGKTTKFHRLTLEMAPGWHVNAHKPLEDFLVPTTVHVGRVADEPSKKSGGKSAAVKITYPKPVTRKLRFNKKPLALYEGTVTIKIRAQTPLAKSRRIRLKAQTCSDRICLEPESLAFVP